MKNLPVQNILQASFSFIEDKIIKPLNTQDKKVFAAAIAIFSLLASLILIYRHSFQAKKTDTRMTKVCFVASHGGPAAHFAVFSKTLDPTKYEVSLLGTGQGLAKFQELQVTAKEMNPTGLNIEKDGVQLARQVANICVHADIVVTDVGHPFSKDLQEALKDLKSQFSFKHLAYYDNPESLVPGGYSKVAAQVMRASNGILFSNSNLVREPLYEDKQVLLDLKDKPLFGIGYYPVEQAEKIRQKRLDQHDDLRSNFLRNHGIADQGQKILIYFGGNNSEYFDKALPRFLDIVKETSQHADFSNTIVVIQQHPGAKAKNEEQRLLNEKKILGNSVIISNFSTDDAVVLADAALYYQTSMGPQFVLAGLPVIQIGHETYEDVLVKNHLCPSVTHASSFLTTLDYIFKQPHQYSIQREQQIWAGLGINKKWKEILQNSLDKIAAQKR